MKSVSFIGSFLAAWSLQAQAGVVRATQLETRDTPDQSCTNGPNTRACWSNGYSIATDFDEKFPVTGNTVTYNLEITNGTCNPDGHGDRLCFLINGQYPGPTIRASWGDQLVVNVQNSMQDNGTSIHWHGVRQYNTPGQDGVNGITECPLAPGHSKTYTFNVTQYGTSWYHAHFSSQYGDGVLGPLVFDGPATANYDIDLGAFPLNEWYYKTAFQINSLFGSALQSNGPGPAADNMLINGTNKDANGAGNYNNVTMEKGKRYRLRLVHVGVDNYMYVSLDNHAFEVITADFVPIQPFTAEWLLMGAGQRYDVIITANQTSGNYWFRTEVATACLSSNNYHGRAVFSYSDVAYATPNSNSFTEPNNCQEATGSLVPYWETSVPEGQFQSTVGDLALDTTKAVVVPDTGSVVVWALNKSIDIDWQNPTLAYVMDGNTSYPESINVVPTTSLGQWNYWVIQQNNAPPIPHPIHLHGHDYFVLGQGSGTFSASTSSLNFDNPPRRDTASIYGGGWLALAFVSNNPGAWLMHCHIAWHISEGLGLQFLEVPDDIVEPNKEAFDAQCAAWADYYPGSYYKKDDSGI